MVALNGMAHAVKGCQPSLTWVQRVSVWPNWTGVNPSRERVLVFLGRTSAPAISAPPASLILTTKRSANHYRFLRRLVPGPVRPGVSARHFGKIGG